MVTAIALSLIPLWFDRCGMKVIDESVVRLLLVMSSRNQKKSTISHPRDLYAVKKVRIHQYVQTDAQGFHWSVCSLVLAFIIYVYT